MPKKPTVYHGTMHVLAQSIWHDAAFLIGTPDALKALRDAITAALVTGTGNVKTFANDGEGYTVYVVSRDDMDGVPCGYTDDAARHRGPWPAWISDIERKEREA
jgi:hypothetical protein